MRGPGLTLSFARKRRGHSFLALGWGRGVGWQRARAGRLAAWVPRLEIRDVVLVLSPML